MTGERGSVTVWVLGFCIGVLFMGGLSIDLWRAFTERREMAGMADGAVVAGATAIDADEWRTNGVIVLDPATSSARAGAYLTAHPEWDPATTTGVFPAADQITVTLEREVDFTLLRILLIGQPPFTVQVTSTAEPALDP